jgi:hypothetical protein
MSIMAFDLHIGIDYSGWETPTSRTPALQVYAAFDTKEPRRIVSLPSTERRSPSQRNLTLQFPVSTNLFEMK